MSPPQARLRRAWTFCFRSLALLLSLFGAWIFLDLYLRVDLPGAALLAHGAFRAIVWPLEWLTEGEGSRLRILLGILAGATLAALVLPRWGRWFWQVIAAVAAAALLLVTALGVLMERALGGGLVLALAGCYLLGALPSRPGVPLSRAGRWGVALAVAAVGGGASYWVYALFMTYGEGYPLLDWLGAMLRHQGVKFLHIYAGALAVLIALAAALVIRPPGGRARRVSRITLATAAGIACALLLDWLFSLDSPTWTTALVIPAGVLVARLVRGLRAPFRVGWSTKLCFAMITPFILALLLIGHTYAARIFCCPEPTAAPYLTRIANLSEVFRVSLFKDHTRLALSARSARRLAWVEVQPVLRRVRYTDPGPARSRGHGARTPDLDGVPEDFVHAPALGRFFVSLTAHDLPSTKVEMGRRLLGSPGQQQDINNLLLTVSGDAAKVEVVVGVPGLCWINCMRWNDPERLLYLGCEDRPGLFRYDPRSRLFKDAILDASIGDVQDIAFNPQHRRLYTVSLWKTPRLTELDWRSLAIRRQVTIGGSHYDVVHDPRSGRVFASAWYASRVRVVNAETLQVVGRIPTGLGTRALAVARPQDLLLVSSIYDGRLRICDPSSGEVRASLPVGGHVKDIAVDEERGLAYFWSQCGLYRLDLSRWARARGSGAQK